MEDWSRGITLKKRNKNTSDWSRGITKKKEIKIHQTGQGE